MAGTGKSSIINDLAASGLEAIDTDYNDWKLFSEVEQEWLLDEEKLVDFLALSQSLNLVISGCCSNQGQFYQYFDHVILLTATLETILARVTARSTNAYGKSPDEQAEISRNFNDFSQKLERGPRLIFDTEHLSIDEMTYAIKQLLLS